jgi:excisionase family DNA binding protein
MSTPTVSTVPEPTGKRMGGVETVAAKLECSTRHVYRLRDAAKMPAPRKLGALLRWDLDEIDQWIAAGCPSCRKGAK